MTSESRSRVIVCRGAIATERRLLAEIDELITGDPEELGLPVRIIVPSRSLRLHLLRRLVREREAVAGVVIQTIGGLAHEILERTGDAETGGAGGFEIVTRRLARAEPSLAAELDELRDGYDIVLGSVRDLVDAGFTPDHEEGVRDKIEELAAEVPQPDRDRALAVVRVAALALEAAAITGGHPRSVSYSRAAEALLKRGAAVLPSRGVLIHGFADLTGVAADFLAAVLGSVGGVVLLDLAPDPADLDRPDTGNAYVDRFRLRLGGLPATDDGAKPTAADVVFIEAPDVEVEARWAAESVRAAVASGIEPEEIGIVARQLGALGPALRRQLRRLGIGFSGVGAVVAGGLLRRKARRLADLFRRESGAELDLWLEVAEGLDGGAGLSLGMRVLSLARLQDLAALNPADPRIGAGVPLPVGRGARSAEDGVEERREPPRLAAASLVAAQRAARSVLGVLDGWPDGIDARGHLARSEELLRALGWDLGTGFGAEVADAIRGIAQDFPTGLELERTEWTSALIKGLDGLGEVPIGGLGGGVQILTVMEARGRTFEKLLLVGVNRGAFPRIAPEDPLLPDAVRARLASDVLPEMPVKARSAVEERYLFAQLLSAGAEVHLSWHLAANGKRTARSSFVDRVATGGAAGPIRTVGSFWSRDRSRRGARPAYEAAVEAAFDDDRNALDRALSRAVADARSMVGEGGFSVASDRVSAARIEVLAAVDDPGRTGAMSPWFGFVGSAPVPDDEFWVTQLEAVARCPWQAFVGRRLGVRPLPDPHLGLPDPDERLVGEVVHRVLDRIATGAGAGRGGAAADAIAGLGVTVPWPSEHRLDNLLADAAARVVFAEGLTGFGLARLLAARARPVLEVAGEVEWAGRVKLDGVLAAEVEGSVRIAPSGPTVRFRADRLDEGPAATDYKTGGPPTTSVQEKTRRKHLVERVRTGRMLQGVAYARLDPDGAGVGRYLYLRPDLAGAPDAVRVFEVEGGDAELAAAFDDAVRAIVAAMGAGSAFPRFKHPTKKSREPCGFCRVREACRRDDPDFTRPLAALMEAADAAAEPAVTAARKLWWLGEDGAPS